MVHSAHAFCPQMDKGSFREHSSVSERQQKPDYSRRRGSGRSSRQLCCEHKDRDKGGGTGGRDRKDKNSCTWWASLSPQPLGGRGRNLGSSKPSSASAVSSIPARTTWGSVLETLTPPKRLRGMGVLISCGGPCLACVRPRVQPTALQKKKTSISLS